MIAIEIAGGAELFVNVRLSNVNDLPIEVEGTLSIKTGQVGTMRSVYLVGSDWGGGKVIMRPIFMGARLKGTSF
jgi:hypothetical protein